MFGSTIESVLRRSANPLEKFDIASDGSMHTFKKYAHVGTPEQIDAALKNTGGWISTPIYPAADKDFLNMQTRFKTHQTSDVKNVLIHAGSIRDAEINILFQYHKIATGTINQGLNIFCGDNAKNIVNWNKDYTHWSQLQPWELREWFSLFYTTWIQEWIESQYQVNSTWLKIKNTDILSDPLTEFRKIINYYGLTEFKEIESFSNEWKLAQQYIVDEFNLLDSIVDYTINNLPLSWNSLNIVAEAIIQQRLRALGYEIRCDGLNTFPTDSKTLYNLLERV